MRIAVIGAGAVGSLLAACLAAGGHGVLLAGRSGPGGAERSTLDLLTPRGERRTVGIVRARAAALLADPDPLRAGGLDAAILAVKRFDLDGAVAMLGTRPDLPVVTVQNGVGAEEAVAALRPGAPLVAASLTAAAGLGPGGESRWLTRGGIGLAATGGPRGDAQALARALASAFRSGGMRATVLDDARAMKWSKVLANLVGNATGALLDLDVAAIYADPALFRVERRQELEALEVMRGLGLAPVALPGADVRLLLAAFRAPPALARPVLARILGGARGEKMPSLRIALRAGEGPTEVAWLNGAVADAGQRQGLPAPVNATLGRLVAEAAADPAQRAWFRGRPDRLLQELGTGRAEGSGRA